MTTEHPTVALARRACAALTMALDTERRAADEVEAGGDDRSAQTTLESSRIAAQTALRVLSAELPAQAGGDELWRMADGARHGYAREKWALRIMALAAEAVARCDCAPPSGMCGDIPDRCPTCGRLVPGATENDNPKPARARSDKS